LSSSSSTVALALGKQQSRVRDAPRDGRLRLDGRDEFQLALKLPAVSDDSWPNADEDGPLRGDGPIDALRPSGHYRRRHPNSATKVARQRVRKKPTLTAS
jgi:hypothetical protein